MAQMMLGVNANEAKRVDETKMNEDEFAIASELSEFKACFDNSYRYLEYTGATYVLGYVNIGFPIEHAFIKVGDRYIDPTYEVFGIEVSEYYSVLEVPLSQMFKIVTEISEHTNDIPRAPMLHGLR